MTQPLQLTYPWALALLLLVIPLVLFWRRSIDGLDRDRRRWHLCLRSLLLATLVLALTDPHWLATSSRRAVAWLVDVSESVGAGAVARFEADREQLRAHGKFDDEIVIPFAASADVTTGGPMVLSEGEQAIDRSATDLGNALRLAAASAPAGSALSVVAFTDGRGAGLLEGASTLARTGALLHAVPVSPPDRPEVLVRSVDAPPRVRSGEPFVLRTEVAANRETAAEIRVYRNGALASAETVSLQPGANRFALNQSVGADRFTEFSVSVVTGDDSLSANNRLSTLVRSGGESKVLLLTDEMRQARYLSWSLKQEGIALDARPPSGAPREAGDLQNYDLLIVDNVAATDLLPSQMELFARYVREQGGGFLMLGGDEAFGLGGYYRTPVETLLPVKCDFEREKETPSLGLVLIIDKSGSMSGEKIEMAKEAAKAAIELLSPNDFAGVVVFDGQAFWAAELQPVVDRFGLIELVGTIQPGGGTSMAPAMELAYSQLSLAPAKLKHVILLTDGHSQPGPFYELTTQMSQDRISVSAVGVGRSADAGLLEQIARWGNGRFYFTEEARSIPQIFAKETMTASKSAIRELPFLPQVVKPAPFLRGIDFTTAPFLYGYVTTEAKPTAETWLATERGDPLLSTWRYGLGNVGAFTSDARNRWALEWLRWDGFGAFWAQVVRRLMRESSLQPFPVAIRPEEGSFQLAVDTIDQAGSFVQGARGRIAVTRPDGSVEEIALEGGIPGRLEAAIPADEAGNYHVDLVVEDARGNELHRQFLSATAGYPAELRMEPPDLEGLRRATAATGGAVNPQVADLTREQPLARREIALWPWLLGLALLWFFLDVVVKRWPGGGGEPRQVSPRRVAAERPSGLDRAA